MRSSNVISKCILTLIAVLSFNIAISTAQGITVNARVYLEGALLNSFETGTTHDRPLMRDDLRDNPFNNELLIPSADIYQTPYEVNDYITIDITDKFTHVACGAYPIYQSIPDPVTVFAVTGEDAIVDWVFLELRDKNDYTSVLATRSALVQRDGDVVDLDGVSKVSFPDVTVDSYFLVARHRNHLGVMTKFPKMAQDLEALVDFSDENEPVFDFANSFGEFNYSGYAMKELNVSNYDLRALWAGDFDANGKVVFSGEEDDLTVLHKEVAQFDMLVNPMMELSYNNSIGYLQADYDMNGKSKFDNPNDDNNMLLAQVIFYGLNADFLTNFAHLVQQLP